MVGLQLTIIERRAFLVSSFSRQERRALGNELATVDGQVRLGCVQTVHQVCHGVIRIAEQEWMHSRGRIPPRHNQLPADLRLRLIFDLTLELAETLCRSRVPEIIGAIRVEEVENVLVVGQDNLPPETILLPRALLINQLSGAICKNVQASIHFRVMRRDHPINIPVVLLRDDAVTLRKQSRRQRLDQLFSILSQSLEADSRALVCFLRFVFVLFTEPF